MSKTIKVLVSLFDKNTAQEVAAKLTSRYSQTHLEFEFQTDGPRALADFKENNHPIIIVGGSLTGFSAETLVQEILKYSGAASILFLGLPNSLSFGFEQMALPITNWDEFFLKVQSSLTEDVKMSLGVQVIRSKLHDELVEYGRQFKAETMDTLNSFSTVGYYLEDSLAADAFTPIKVNDRSSNKDASPIEQIRFKQTWLVALDSAFFIGLMLLSFYVFRNNQGDEFSWLSWAGLVYVATICSAITFFSSSLFDYTNIKPG